MGTDTPAWAEFAEVVWHRGRGTDIEWVQGQFAVIVPVLFMVASSFLVSSNGLCGNSSLKGSRCVCIIGEYVSGIALWLHGGSVRFVGEV